MLKSFFLSERKLVYAILRVKLEYMKDVSFSWRSVRASMHRITSFELLRTLIAVLVQKSKWRECKPTYAESFFLSERKLVYAILRVKLEYMKDVSFSWNEMLFAMQKTDFNVLELVCRASYVRASMHRITSFELLRTLIAVLVQKSKWRDASPHMLKSSFSERKLFYAI